MLENKYLVNLYILSLGKIYEVYIPANEKIGNIAKLLNTTMFDSIDFEKNNHIINAQSGIIYNNNDIIIDTDIKNYTELILI